MIYQIILLIIPVLIAVLASCLYQNKSRRMLRFYDRMITFESFRKFYTLVLLLVLLLVNYAQHQLYPTNWIVLVSSGLSLVLFNYKWSDKLLRCLKDRPKIFHIVATLNIIVMFVPYLNTITLPIACILMAAIFYPSTQILNWTNNPEMVKQVCEQREALAIHYF